jgi:hypothetical protein
MLRLLQLGSPGSSKEASAEEFVQTIASLFVRLEPGPQDRQVIAARAGGRGWRAEPYLGRLAPG